MTVGGDGSSRPNSGLGGGDLAGLWPLIAQFGVMSRMSSGSSTVDLFLALALPMLLSQLGVLFQALVLLLHRSFQSGAGFQERRITHQLTTSYWMNFHGRDDEDTGEHAFHLRQVSSTASSCKAAAAAAAAA